MKKTVLIGILVLAAFAQAENYLIQGGQASRIEYRLSQQIEIAAGTQSLTLSFVLPEAFDSPTYKQRIENLKLNFSSEPTTRDEKPDARGNHIVKVTWRKPTGTIDAVMTFTAINQTVLAALKSTAPFPLQSIPENLSPYLKATAQVQSNDGRIQAKARELTAGVQTHFDAVQRILTWVVDHLNYVTPPRQYDALYSFESGKGNCQNYSHLAAALMRVVSIPVRIVNGVTLKEPYTVKSEEGEYTFKMGQGRHSWIEVWFPDLGWVPFDPQQTELFVSNRFVRIEVGTDNDETVNDGMIRWSKIEGSGNPSFQEVIDARFPEDRVNLSLVKQNYGPQAMLLCPEMHAVFTPVKVTPPPPPPKVEPKDLETLQFKKPYLFGNLDYPRNVDFRFIQGPADKGAGEEYVMHKTFLVETAEYVTTKMIQYAQVFILDKPLKLIKVGLALHKFGGSGQLWLELMDDKGGKPGKVLAASDLQPLEGISSKAGYDWLDFDFSRDTIRLSPGRYWIVMGFTGSPIVNWFYTYGKPVGPVDGTRYKSVYEETWSGAMTYEFNYRVAGWTPE